MPELLVEVGTEELPALDAPELASQLKDRVLSALTENHLPHKDAEVLWTPRRLALIVHELAPRQEDQVEEVRGPAVAVGLDQAGRPTQAALGFLRRYGASSADLLRRRVGEREYLFLRVFHQGRPTQDVLPEILPKAFQGISCRKAMRWDDSGVSFLRPIRWLVCLYDGEVLPVRLGNLVAGRVTRGHRFFGPKNVEISSPGEYRKKLQQAHVLVDPKERRERVLAAVEKVEKEYGVRAVLSQDLIARIVGSAEWPVGVVGTIPAEFLSLPAPVIEETLSEEGKFVPFVKNGEPASTFLGFRDGADDDRGFVRQGFERVVRARLRDSAFFFARDRCRPLSERVRDLAKVVYEARLGTMWQRVERIRIICSHLAQALRLPADLLDRAAFLSKADLVTDIVKEFPNLEGVIGGIYARLDGEPPEVALAIQEHVLPRSWTDSLPKTPLGIALSLADKLDAVVGAIRIGEVPTGSHDPYGIRRRGGAIVHLVLEHKLSVDLFSIIDATSDLYPPGDPSLVKAFLVDRLRAALETVKQLPYDVVDAVLAVPKGDFLGVYERAFALARLRGELSELAVAFSRVRNITKDHNVAGFDPDEFIEEAERELWRAYLKTEGQMNRALEQRDYEQAIRHLLFLVEPIDRYFDEVLVMAEDHSLRQNRLGFLTAVTDLFFRIGDLSRLVVD